MTDHPLIKPGVDGQPTFTVSANSLGVADRCARAYWHYKVHKRKAVRSAAGLIAGSALHEGIAALQKGGSVLEQEKAIAAVLLESPTPADDYRSGAYLRDAMAGFRAEFADVFRGWRIEETEAQGTVPLGTVQWALSDIEPYTKAVTVLWEFRRDLVGVAPCGERYIVDWKTASRNEDAHYLAMKNSGQFLGYIWSWNYQHPEDPADGVLPVRIILRKPSRTGVAFEFPKDPPIIFEPERVEEWRRHTLAKIAGLLSRDPSDPDQWPLACAELGLCRHTYGVCDYLPVCIQPPAKRMTMLQSDAYEDARERIQTL